MKQGIDLTKYIQDEITLDKLMPKKFYINKEGNMVGEITIGQANIISTLLIELQEDNNKLNKELENLEKLNNANYQSFIETNNIINEFEKWLEVNLTNLEKEKTSNIYNEGLKQGMLSNGRLIKSKLQKLKGVDKE